MTREGLSEEVSSSAKDSEGISLVGGGGERASRVEGTGREQGKSPCAGTVSTVGARSVQNMCLLSSPRPGAASPFQS